MESLKELYRVGPGPSSSHTLAIQHACLYFIKQYPNIDEVVVDLFGSLSLTGKGHRTDKIIDETCRNANKTVEVRFQNDWNVKHPNTLVIKDVHSDTSLTIYSVGGGAIRVEGVEQVVNPYVYPHHSFADIVQFCNEKNLSLYEYVTYFEPEIDSFLSEILDQMLKTVEQGLHSEGMLPGLLNMQRVANDIYKKAEVALDPAEKKTLLLTAYAYACAEENADGKTVVTAPTLGSCGVIPAVMSYYYHVCKVDKKRLQEALAVGGIFGNLIKTNATISGAEGGCQAEIGAACAMAAAACSYIENLSFEQIGYAAEIGIEHHLGLTCDPVGGYVMIPCIERNGVAALRAMDAMLYAKHIGSIKPNKITFDMVVQTMKYTGKKLALELKETSLGGLALVMPIHHE